MKLQLYFTVEQKIVRIICEYMVFFDTEQFEIIESRITDITIFRKMVEKLNDFGFENEKHKENNPNFDINIVKLMCNNKV